MKAKPYFVHVIIVPKGSRRAGDYEIIYNSTRLLRKQRSVTFMGHEAKWLSEASNALEGEDYIHAIFAMPGAKLLVAYRNGKRVPHSNVPTLRVPAQLTPWYGTGKNDHDPTRRRKH